MPEIEKDVFLEVNGRHKDVRINVDSRGHGEFTFNVSSGGSGRKEPYEGPYAVSSEAYEMQLFPTENKVMTENLIVLPIPYSETSNPKGGLTVCIGGD